MSVREVDSARTFDLSLYTSLTASRAKDFELGEGDISAKSEDLNPPLPSDFVSLSLPPLQEAAERGDSDTVSRLLLDKNIDVNEKAGGHRAQRTALHRSAGYGHLTVVRQLLKVSWSDKWSGTGLTDLTSSFSRDVEHPLKVIRCPKIFEFEKDVFRLVTSMGHDSAPR